jgi:uncharacterized membrane protein YraQ (UPF0718 family)
MEQITKIAVYIFESFLHIWPYLLITVPLAVAVKLTNISKFINRALSQNPLVSIILATALGAISPFCSCGVIPVIAALLIGGVPIAPVMSFWIASPSMDPEIFFLSTAAIGWKLSVWRLAATFAISLLAGYITHFAVKNGFLGKELLRTNQVSPVKKRWKTNWYNSIRVRLRRIVFAFVPWKGLALISGIHPESGNKGIKMDCCAAEEYIASKPPIREENGEEACNKCQPKGAIPDSFINNLLNEIWKASSLVIKFMALAFFINALIAFYVPEDFISNLLGGNGGFSIIIATLVGIPAYTSNITALPLIGGLLSLGMNEGAALAFLIAGPTTTLPALMAVWGIAKRRVVLMYLSFSLVGAILFGFIYQFIN